MASPIFELRLKQLENNLNRVATRIYEYQTELEDENDPNRKSQYRRRIEQLKELLSEYQSEYDELKGRGANESSIEMQEVSDQLKRLNIQINAIGNLVLKSHQDLRQILLTRYSASEQKIISEIAKQLNQSQLATVEAVLQAVETNQIPEREMQQFVTEVQQTLTLLNQKEGALSPEKQKVFEIVNAPTLDFQHKVKISLPIIPFLMDYEGELSLGTGFNLKAIWEQWRGKFRGK